MEKEKFNQVKYQNEWLKKNYTKIGVSCRSDFVDEFRNACKALGRTGVHPAEISGSYTHKH